MGNASWPELSYPVWRDTAATLQLWTQIVGKIRLSLSPWLNHGWQVPLYVTARGLGTSSMPVGHEILEIEFDFLSHLLRMRMSSGEERELPLQPQSVADFYARIRAVLEDLRIEVAINEMPNEVADPIRFSEDRVHASYDPDAAHRFWRALVQADRVFKLFRSGFVGKSSPVHFFWGSFDLAVTRFSGRTAPLHPGGVPGLPDPVTREAYSHEVSSAGFWPGSDAFPQPAFYSYAYPEPPGFREAAVPQGASFDTTLGEFILPYDTVRQSADPDALLLDFLVATYNAAADAGHWDRAALECAIGAPARVRAV
ncbi:DUF5996 family protein [Microvirga sesbaniae]|uniref:DUF5996 family protein n=1 Tax=Microvirga sesbaniae TaxID=681392 RepID=UPI0021C7FCA5|nr:DUF5996 family protein [Microvirga sp. HBU67692]